MPICSKCAIQKSESEFYYRNKAQGRLHAQCKDCYSVKRQQFWKKHYLLYGDLYRERAIKRNKRIKDVLRMRMLQYLEDKGCVHCGISDPRVLEFDHIDPAMKKMGIAKAITDGLHWEDILTEIAKCQILCANCHKIKLPKSATGTNASYAYKHK